MGTDYPLWFRITIYSVLTLLLVGNVAADIFKDGYDGISATLLLAGIVGTSVGVVKIIKGGGDKP